MGPILKLKLYKLRHQVINYVLQNHLQPLSHTGSCKRNVPLFENSRPSAARQLSQPMYSQSANFGKFKLNSLNLAPFLLLNPVHQVKLSTLQNIVDNLLTHPVFG